MGNRFARRSLRIVALAGTALATPLLAQTPGSLDTRLSDADIIVTATKQDVAVSRVPISIGVVTRDAIDDQSLRTVEDLSRVTPGLFINSSNSANGSSTVAIRGITSAVGAPTVGIYLDDIPITRRSAGGAYAGNGTNFPQLFDLDHVEVLRGPQGTLYGGSSIGGTLKFILPQPSLSETHFRAKAEVANTKAGDPTFELGLSTQMPLVEDKIGLSASIYGRHNGGWIDHVSRFTGAVLDADTNSQDSYSGRVAILFKPTENFSIQPAFYGSYDRYNDQDIYWTDSVAYTQAPITTQSTAASPTINRLPYTHPGFSFPAYSFGPYKTGVNCNVGANFASTVNECVQKAKRTSKLYVPSLTLGYDLGGIELKSITSYTRDVQTGNTPSSYEDLNLFTQLGGRQFIQDLPVYRSDYLYDNKRTGWTQELRVATDNSKPLSFVGGAFYSNFKTTSDYVLNAPNTADLFRVLFNQTIEARSAGVNTGENVFFRNQYLREKELAVFGEATYKLTDKLSVLGGLRLSKVTFGFSEAQYGSNVSRAVAVPGSGLVQGSVTDKPISPKIAVQYFIDGRNMIYASAAKGFRAGGVASRPAGAACEAELVAQGNTSSGSQPYESDTVWSYEIGAKVRPFGEVLSVDASIYRVDWKNTQVNYRLQCGLGYVANAGSARSQGLDLSAQLRPTSWLTLNGNLAYIDAKYDELLFTSPAGVRTTFIMDGDRMPIPKWSYAIGAQVTLPVREGVKAYARGDYQYAGKYPRSFGPLTQSFFPDVYIANSTQFVSARIGIENGRWDLSLFANNLFNSQDVTSVNFNAGRGSCTIPAVGVYNNCTRNPSYAKQTTFRPQTIGLSARYKY